MDATLPKLVYTDMNVYVHIVGTIEGETVWTHTEDENIVPSEEAQPRHFTYTHAAVPRSFVDMD